MKDSVTDSNGIQTLHTLVYSGISINVTKKLKNFNRSLIQSPVEAICLCNVLCLLVLGSLNPCLLL